MISRRRLLTATAMSAVCKPARANFAIFQGYGNAIGNGLTVNLTFDGSQSNWLGSGGAANFESLIQQAASMIEAVVVTSPMTVNVTASCTNSTGDIGGGGPSDGAYVAYSVVYPYLMAVLQSPGPANLPTPGTAGIPTSVGVWGGTLKAMAAAGYITLGQTGYISPTNPAQDGTISFTKDFPAAYLIGGALQEITHAMGRVFMDNATYATVMSLFRFTSVGTRLFGYNSPPAPVSYFSLDNGNTNLAEYGTSYDPTDFTNANQPNDPFAEYQSSTIYQYLTPLDIVQINAMGFGVT